MKVAILSESSADEAAVRILANGILQEETEPVGSFPLRARGWPSVGHVLPAVIKHVYYQTEAEGLVVVVDSNHSKLHQGNLDAQCAQDRACRLCLLRNIVTQVQDQLRSVPARAAFKIGLGLAVPAIETWYLCGIRSGVSEAAWRTGLETGKYPYTKNQLKQYAYGTERRSLEMETRHAIEQARRLVDNLPLLNEKFPLGFGSLQRDLRSW